MKLTHCFAGIALVFCLVLPGQAAAQSADPAFVQQLRQALTENPDILLDVLAEQGDFLLNTIQAASDQQRTSALLLQWEEDIKIPKNPVLDNRPARGPRNAPVTIVAFSDFTCSYCQQAAFSIENLLYGYPEQVRFVFKQVPHTEPGLLASQWFLAAMSIDPAKAWHLYALFFDNQQELIKAPQDVMFQVAAQVGLDPQQILQVTAENINSITSILDQDLADADELGFVGTPYFLVNNQIIRGALPLEDFITAVEFALAH